MITDIHMYKALRTKIGDTEAEELVSFVKAEINNGFMDHKDVFLVKEDKLELIMLMKQDKLELISLMKEDKLELIDLMNSQKEDLVKLINDTKSELRNNKADLLKAIYAVGLVQFIIIIASLIGIVAFMLPR